MTSDIAGQDSIAFQQKLYDDPNHTRRGLHRARRSWIEQRLSAFLSGRAHVMEVGVGCGTFTQFLSRHDVHITAVDINQSFLDGVSSLGGVKVINGDATKDLGLRDMDIILCSEVLEHVPASQSQDMMDQFYNSLQPDGVLILTTPQRFSTVELMARLFKFPLILWIARKIYGSAEELGHINLLTRGQLKFQIKKAGFAIQEEDRFGFYLPFVAEFGGSIGAKFLQHAGEAIKKIPLLRHLIWTQAYVLTKSKGS